jgi:hypothetical protein
MSEGAVHARLVKVLLQTIVYEFDGDTSFIWADQPADRRLLPTFAIGDMRPDLYARDQSASRTIIGEAKSANDVDTLHTRAQLKEFFEHLASERDGMLWIAVPLARAGEAFRVARGVRSSTGMHHVKFVVSGWLLGPTDVEQRWHG